MYNAIKFALLVLLVILISSVVAAESPVGDNLLYVAVEFGYSVSSNTDEANFEWNFRWSQTQQRFIEAEARIENQESTFPIEQVDGEWLWVGPEDDAAVVCFLNHGYSSLRANGTIACGPQSVSTFGTSGEAGFCDQAEFNPNITVETIVHQGPNGPYTMGYLTITGANSGTLTFWLSDGTEETHYLTYGEFGIGVPGDYEYIRAEITCGDIKVTAQWTS